jgi:hypothetical protein
MKLVKVEIFKSSREDEARPVPNTFQTPTGKLAGLLLRWRVKGEDHRIAWYNPHSREWESGAGPYTAPENRWQWQWCDPFDTAGLDRLIAARP